MCQAYEGERNYLMQRDREERRKKYEAYKRGEIKLTDEELDKMAIEALMARDG